MSVYGQTLTGCDKGVFHRTRLRLSPPGESWRASALCGVTLWFKHDGAEGTFCGRCAQVLAYHAGRGGVWINDDEEMQC